MKKIRSGKIIKKMVTILLFVGVMIVLGACSGEVVEEVVEEEPIPSHSDYEHIEVYDDVYQYKGLTVEQLFEKMGPTSRTYTYKDDFYYCYYLYYSTKKPIYFNIKNNKVVGVEYTFMDYYDFSGDMNEPFYIFGIEPDYSTLNIGRSYGRDHPIYNGVNKDIKSFDIMLGLTKDENGEIVRDENGKAEYKKIWSVEIMFK